MFREGAKTPLGGRGDCLSSQNYICITGGYSYCYYLRFCLNAKSGGGIIKSFKVGKFAMF